MIPAQFPESNVIFAMEQDEYEPIEGYKFADKEGRVAVCFRLTPTEIEELTKTRTLWIQQLTFNRGFTPIALSTQRPDDLPKG